MPLHLNERDGGGAGHTKAQVVPYNGIKVPTPSKMDLIIATLKDLVGAIRIEQKDGDILPPDAVQYTQLIKNLHKIFKDYCLEEKVKAPTTTTMTTCMPTIPEAPTLPTKGANNTTPTPITKGATQKQACASSNIVDQNPQSTRTKDVETNKIGTDQKNDTENRNQERQRPCTEPITAKFKLSELTKTQVLNLLKDANPTHMKTLPQPTRRSTQTRTINSQYVDACNAIIRSELLNTSLEIHCHVVKAVYNKKTRKMEEYRQLIVGDEKYIWITASLKEFGP